MNQFEDLSISQIESLLAENGYEVTELEGEVLRIRDLDTGITFQTALEGNVLYMTVNLVTVPSSAVNAEMMRKMLAADSGITTSSFQLVPAGDGKTAITLNNFCTLQNMGVEDQDDVLSLAGYLMADLLEARELLEPMVKGVAS
jgi:hypothetical protein